MLLPASVVVVCLLVTQRLSVSVGEKKMHQGKTTLEFQIARSRDRGTRQDGKSTEKVHNIISENRGNFHFFVRNTKSLQQRRGL